MIRSTPLSHHFPSRSRMKAVSAAASASSGASAAAAMLVVRVVPEAAQEARGEAQRAVGPVERLGRAGGVEDGEPHGVGAVLGDQLVGIDDVAEVLAHLAPVGDHHLVEEAAGEGLAVREEGEGADVAQRLGHDPLVEDEAAAVVAGDEPLGGKPVPQVGVGEHLLVAILRRHGGRHPEPEGVEVAVERVGLAPRRAAAARAGGLQEVGALGQRVALAGRLDVARQHHRQVLDRDRDHPALLAVQHRDRRAPVALARDREVIGAVAGRLARLQAGGRAAAERLAGRARHPRRDRLVGLIDAGDAERGGGAVAGVDDRRDEERQRCRPPATSTEAPVSITGTAEASRALRSQPPERSSSSCSATAGSAAQRSSVGMARREQHEAGLAHGVRVRGEDLQAVAVGAAEVELDPVAAAEDVALGLQRELVPVGRAGRGCGRSPRGRGTGAGTRSGGGSAAPCCGSASSGRPRPAARPASSGRCRTSRRWRRRGRSARPRRGSGRATATSGTEPRRSCRRRGRSRRRSRVASSARASAPRSARPTRPAACRARSPPSPPAGRRRRSRSRRGPRRRGRGGSARRRRRSSSPGRGPCAGCPR